MIEQKNTGNGSRGRSVKTILVVENDDTLREKTCDHLKAEGYNVLLADDGHTGLQQAIGYLPDLILYDMVMPGMDGHDFYKNILQNKITSSIPLIFVTALSEKENFRAGMNLGADDFITKPFDYDSLLSSIKTRLEKRDRLQQKNDEKFYAFIDNTLTGVFIYRKNRFDFVNEKCAKIFGLSPTDFLDLSFYDLIIDHDRDHVLWEIEDCFSNKENNLHLRFQARHIKGQHEVAVELFASIVNYKGVDSLAGYMLECV
jgi:PAS domain S-box-containing protein